MISLSKAEEIISSPSQNNITFKEWSELPLGVNAKNSYMSTVDNFGSLNTFTRYMAEQFQSYKDDTKDE